MLGQRPSVVLVSFLFVLLPEPARAEGGLDVTEEILCFTDRPNLKNFAVLASTKLHSEAVLSPLALVADRTLQRSERIDGKDAAIWALNTSCPIVSELVALLLKCDGHGDCVYYIHKDHLIRFSERKDKFLALNEGIYKSSCEHQQNCNINSSHDLLILYWKLIKLFLVFCRLKKTRHPAK